MTLKYAIDPARPEGNPLSRLNYLLTLLARPEAHTAHSRNRTSATRITPDMNTLSTKAKGLLRSGASQAYHLTGRYKRANLGHFIVLMYHRVLPDNDPSIPYLQPGMYVRVSSFRKQMEFLSDNYQIITIQDMLQLIEARQTRSDKQYCVLTFDDGWLDNYEHAFPVLKSFSAPATIFLAAAFIGTDRTFWHEKVSRLFFESRHSAPAPRTSTEPGSNQLQQVVDLLRRHVPNPNNDRTTIDKVIEALKQFPPAQIEAAVAAIAIELNLPAGRERTMLNWTEIEEMGRNRITFGSHTREHKLLTKVSIDEADSEIRLSLEELRMKVPSFVPVFCYPNGHYNSQVKSIVANAGYSAAVTTERGRESATFKDRFAIRRIGIHDDITYTKPLFSLRLSSAR